MVKEVSRMHQSKDKTNVMRILDSHKINYCSHYFETIEAVSGVEVATILHQNPDKVFKTLVTCGKPNCYYVFVIPVNKELNLKKVAKLVNEKKIDMIKSKELYPLTGYVHGGCSPIGMKKVFKTIIDETAKKFDTILFSGGKIGYQIEMNANDLQRIISCSFKDLLEEETND